MLIARIRTAEDAPQPAVSTPISFDDIVNAVYIPSVFTLLLASLSYTACNAALGFLLSNEPNALRRTFAKWKRVFLLSRFIPVVQPNSTQVIAATDRCSPQAPDLAADRMPLISTVEEADRVHTCLYDNASFFRDLHNGVLLAHDPETSPLGPVQAPVLREAVVQSLNNVRVQAERLVFPFHSLFMVFCACKSLTMLIYIQYHFGEVPGGWGRFCICGAANVLCGLLTSVMEYVACILLPVDSAVAKRTALVSEEEPKDSVFIVELLMRIGQLELNDLSTVLIQGSTFVIFAAVFLPMFAVFCLVGCFILGVVLVPLWTLWVVVRFRHYQHRTLLLEPSSTWWAYWLSRLEVLKVILMKITTLWLLQYTVQASLLAGMALIWHQSPLQAFKFTVTRQIVDSFVPWSMMSTFHRVCFVSQLLL